METKLNCSALCSSADCTIDPAMNTEDGQRLLQQLCNIQVNIMSEVKHISPVLFGMMCTLLSCGILLALFFLIFTIKFKQNRIVKMSSPNLNIVTIIGSVFTYVSGYMFGIVEEKTAEMEISTELIFQIRIWMLCLGISLIFGPILGKTWRLYKVFGQHVPEKRVIIKDIQLLGLVAGVIGLDILILVTWGIADPLQCMESLNAGVRVVEKYLSYSITIMKCCVSQYTDIWIILISLLKVRQWKQFEEELNHTPNQMAKYFNSPSKSFRSMYSDDQIYYLLGENNSMKQLLTEKNAVIESLQEQVNNVKDKLVQLMTPDCTEELMDYISTSGSKTAHYTLINSEVKSHNTATKDPESEKPLSDKQTNLDQTFGSQQDLKPLSLQSNFHKIMGESKNVLDSTLCPQKRPKNVINYQSSHKSAQNHPGQPENSEINPEDFSNSCDTLEKASEVQTNDCAKMTPQPTGQILVSSAIHPSIRSRSIECASVKDPTKMIKNNYVSSEKLQEILQELNVNAVTSVGLPERPRQMLQNCLLEQCTQRAEQLNHCHHSISPYMVRQRKPPFYSITGSPHHYFPYSKARRIKYLVNENVSRDTIIPETIRLESIHHKRLTDENRPTSLSAALSSVKKLDALSDSNQLYAKKDQKHGDIYYSTLEGKHIMKPYSDLDVTKAHLRVEESEVGGKDGAFQIYQYDYSDSESSSSDETFCCYHRACCEACCRGSYNSSTSETSDSEQYNPSFNWPQKHFRNHPIVNFKEDLKPTFV
ncbi:probable G-protein coupled receptor 156 isoform X2 [Chiloscyllium punctatum]|uniref:probable G-protein coupled receptor 156 isoform X2 n=1 Tax=Chiloscyllium punctatum TaxID=137246 RepID=UPI003B6343BC